MITCCPKCGSTSGFYYAMTVKHQMFGEWGKQAEAESATDTTTTKPRCITCNKCIRLDVAEGKGKP